MDTDVEHQLLDLAFNSMRDLVLIKGPDSRILWANSAFLDCYGMTLQELKDLVDGPQSDPDDTLQYVRDDAMVFELGDHVDIPSEALREHDGATRLYHTIKSPIMVDGMTTMSVGVSRRHEDADLHVSPSHQDAKAVTKPLRLLTAAFPLPMLVLDVRGRIVSTSPEWEEAFGAVPASAGVFFAEAYPDLASIAPDQAVRGAEAPVDPQRMTVTDNGRHFEMRLGPWRYQDGTCGGTMILALDVSVEAAQTAALQEVNERLDMVIAGSSVGIWDWIDVTGQAEYWSPKFHHLLGYEVGEIEQSLDQFSELLHPDDREPTFALVDEHFTDSVPFDINYRLRTKSGQYRWFRGTGLAARDGEGNPTRMVGSIQDIHEQVEGQRALNRMNEDLEHFAHLAAHDLREPARRQRVLAGLAMEDHGDEMSPELRRSLEAIQNQSKAMLSMIDGFRTLAGFSGPGVELVEVNLQVMAEKLIAELVVGEESSDVSIDLPQRLLCYPILVELLLRNLISNAMRYGSRPLSLAFGHRTEGRETVMTATNSWNGNPQEVSDKIFRPFVTGRDAAGTGLGLAICRRVTEHHRGWIQVEPGQGLFCIEFNLGDG